LGGHKSQEMHAGKLEVWKLEGDEVWRLRDRKALLATNGLIELPKKLP
jgi:hypothetical protein